MRNATVAVERCTPGAVTGEIGAVLHLAPAFVDVRDHSFDVDALRRAMGPWSSGEQLMARAALALWNWQEKLNLWELATTLDSDSLTRVVEAILVLRGELGVVPAENRPDFGREGDRVDGA